MGSLPGALCVDTDPSIFYPDLYYVSGRTPQGMIGSKLSEASQRAKAYCAQCPAQVACLERALELREPDGIWGGATPRERSVLIKARARTA